MDRRELGKKRSFGWFFIVFLSVLIIITACANGYLYYSEQQKEAQFKKQLNHLEKIVADRIAAIEKKKKEPVYITLPGATKIRAIVENYEQPESLWTLANKTHSLPTDYIPSPISVPSVATRTDKTTDEQSVRTDITNKVKILFDAAAADGHNLMIGSGYRSASLQAVYFNALAASVGDTVANQSIARPGQSEHQTGLAIDISTLSQSCYLNECFATTADGEWLAANSYKYGFILRYPKDKVTITGYQYEPWHFRYVGVNLATALHESNLTLEEAWSYLETALSTLKENRAL